MKGYAKVTGKLIATYLQLTCIRLQFQIRIDKPFLKVICFELETMLQLLVNYKQVKVVEIDQLKTPINDENAPTTI